MKRLFIAAVVFWIVGTIVGVGILVYFMMTDAERPTPWEYAPNAAPYGTPEPAPAQPDP